MVYLSIFFKFFKGCLPQILLGPLLNTLSQLSVIKIAWLTIFTCFLFRENSFKISVFACVTHTSFTRNNRTAFYVSFFWNLCRCTEINTFRVRSSAVLSLFKPFVPICNIKYWRLKSNFASCLFVHASWVEPRCWVFIGSHIYIIYFNISTNTGFLKPLFVSLHLLRSLFFQISQVCFYHNLHFCHSLIFL